TFSEDAQARYRAYGWHVQAVADGNDVDAILDAVAAAKAEDTRPSLIAVRTVIGYGAPEVAGTSKVHGSPLGAKIAEATKVALGIDWPEFTVPDDVAAHMHAAGERGASARRAWLDLYDSYRDEHPTAAAELSGLLAGSLPDGFERDLPTFEPGTAIATRKASAQAL